jgi:hypothetical protein
MATARNRGLVWLTALAAALALAVAIAGFRDVLPRVFALLGLAMFAACLVLVAMVGWRTRQEMLVLREAAARGQAIVLLAARLRDEDGATLEAMARRGGTAGEAATLILQGRAERQRGPGSPPSN